MSQQQHNSESGHEHIASLPFSLGVFFALIGLTLLTVGISYVHLGPWNLAVAVLIATIKATLVAMFFMHLRYDHPFNAAIFVGSLVFFGIFVVYTMNDTEHRAQLDENNGATVLPATGEQAPGGWKDRGKTYGSH